MAQPVETLAPLIGAPVAAPSLTRPRAEQLWLAVHLPRTDPLALESMAACCLRLTSMVSLERPEDLLLEVAGSLRLFGGLAALKKKLSAEIESRRLVAHLCAAPTTLAALWLARHRCEDALSLDVLSGRLNPLPLSTTRWPDETQALLSEMGIRTLGDCLRLPRAGFARRVGRRYLLDLDEALGRQFSGRLGFDLPQRLSAKIELAEESTDRSLLASVQLKLIERLVAVLRRRQAQVQSLELIFFHGRCSPTTQWLRLIEPAHDEQRFASLICDKLERMALPEAVVAVGLRTAPLQPMRLRKPALFGNDDGPPDEASMSSLIERLRSRFGAEHVYCVEPAADHRPERAWTKTINGLLQTRPAPPLSPWSSHWPLWLLPVPLPLGGVSERSAVHAGPERIESGWWDGADAVRDYYTLVTPRGERLWAYRQRIEPHRWFLHGIFG